MSIRASDLTRINTMLRADPDPTLSGTLNVNNFGISNGTNPVLIGGNSYPSSPGTLGYVLTADGSGNLIFTEATGYSPELYAEKAFGPVTPVANGTNSVAIGNAASTSSSAPNSVAIGQYSLSKIPGSLVQASGRFASVGDAQVGRYLLRSTTINNSPVELFVDGTGGSSHLTLPDDATWTYRIMVTGHRTDGSDGHAGYSFTGVVYRGTGAASIRMQGSLGKVTHSESNSSWDVDVVADQASGALRILVRGENGKTIRWVALVETVEITN